MFSKYVSRMDGLSLAHSKITRTQTNTAFIHPLVLTFHHFLPIASTSTYKNSAKDTIQIMSHRSCTHPWNQLVTLLLSQILKSRNIIVAMGGATGEYQATTLLDWDNTMAILVEIAFSMLYFLWEEQGESSGCESSNRVGEVSKRRRSWFSLRHTD